MIKRVRKNLVSLFTLFFVISGFGGTLIQPVSANFEGQSVQCLTGNNDTKQDSPGDIGDAVGSGGDYTVEGSEANKVAHSLFDNFIKRGFSGAGAAGATAVANRESRYDVKAVNVGGGVAGVYQWSGYVNNTNGNRITATGKIKPGDVSTLTLENEIDLVNFELSHDKKAVSNTVGHASDPGQAAKDWSYMYEGVASEDGQSKTSMIVADAQKIYNQFGGEGLDSDDSLLGDSSGSDNGAIDGKADENQSKDACDTGGATDTTDGTGDYGDLNELAWREYSELPDSVKKYAHDPATLLGSRGDGSNWTEASNQCVGLTVSYGNAIWGQYGTKIGNGFDQANAWAQSTSTTVGNDPKSGDIFSAGDGEPGHTGIVEHVFANGDILIVEQNYTGMSGEAAGETCTWDFRIATKAYTVGQNYVYDYPGDNSNIKLNWGQ